MRFAVLAVLTVLLLPGCGGGGSSPRVLLVGDSNIALRPGAMKEGFAGYKVDTRAQSGAAILPGDCTDCSTVDWATKLAGAHADVVIVNLGINDSLFEGTPTTQGWADYGTKIDWLMDQPPDQRVLWSNLPCRLEPARRREGCAAVNAALAEAEQRWDRLTVVDWSSAASADGFYPRDVHLTFEAAKAWAQLMATHI